MSANPLRSCQLPLLGSNQDSPDPESRQRPPSTGKKAQKSVEIGPNPARSTHENTHDSSTPKPPRRGRTLEYHREWRRTPSGKASLRESQRIWAEKYPERLKAQRTVNYATRRGRLRRGPCELAGDGCKGRIEAHHDDYTKPLEVRWLCKRHHRQADAERRAGAA